MRSRSVVAVHHRDGRSRCTTLRSDPPISLRATPQGLYLVGSAAGPIGGDESSLDVSVGAGAELTVRSAAASMALPGPRGLPSVAAVTVTIGAGAALWWLPEPIIAAGDCDHRSKVRIALGPQGRLVWREELMLGRSAEEGGSILTELSIDDQAGPVLRHGVGLGPRFGWWSGPAGTGGARAVGALIVAGFGAEQVRAPHVAGVRAALGTLQGGAAAAATAVVLTVVADNPRLLRVALDAALPSR